MRSSDDVAEAGRLLEHEHAYRAMNSSHNPFGDERAAERIVKTLDRWRRRNGLLLDSTEQFTLGETFTS